MGAVGDKLRQARERSNRTIRAMSDITKIRGDHLEALEEGRYEVFSAPVYIRGFVRNYAGALRLNVPEILAELEEELGRTGRFSEHPRLAPHANGILDYLMLQVSKINWSVALPLLLLFLIVASALLSYRYYQNSQNADPLKDLGPGFYQPPPTGETLPLPAVTNR